MTEKEYWILETSWKGGANFPEVCSSKESAVNRARNWLAKENAKKRKATIRHVSVVASYDVAIEFAVTEVT